MGKLKLILTFAVLIFGQIAAWNAAAAPENAGDILKGAVIDAETGEPLIGAAILVSNTTEGVITDLDGTFNINLLRDYTAFEVSYIGYKSMPFEIITYSGQMRLNVAPEFISYIALTGNTLSISMQPDGEMLANAVVTGRKNLESLQALRNERITSGFAIENIGASEMSIKGLSDAQESVTKMSGISVADAGQLIVRGLGDRYSTTTLNGLPIASPNPDNKLIPLDIFPASTIQNITVSKVYEASSYADYSGAHVDISTKEGKSEDFFNVSFSTGGYFNTLAAGKFRTMDYPSLFVTPRLDAAANNIKYAEFAQYSRNNKIFDTGFTTSEKSILPDMNGSIGWGKTLTFGTHDLSILATASVKSGDEIYPVSPVVEIMGSLDIGHILILGKASEISVGFLILLVIELDGAVIESFEHHLSSVRLVAVRKTCGCTPVQLPCPVKFMMSGQLIVLQFIEMGYLVPAYKVESFEVVVSRSVQMDCLGISGIKNGKTDIVALFESILEIHQPRNIQFFSLVLYQIRSIYSQFIPY